MDINEWMNECYIKSVIFCHPFVSTWSQLISGMWDQSSAHWQFYLLLPCLFTFSWQQILFATSLPRSLKMMDTKVPIRITSLLRKQYCTAEVPNPWAAAHYWTLSLLEPGRSGMCMCAGASQLMWVSCAQVLHLQKQWAHGHTVCANGTACTHLYTLCGSIPSPPPCRFAKLKNWGILLYSKCFNSMALTNLVEDWTTETMKWWKPSISLTKRAERNLKIGSYCLFNRWKKDNKTSKCHCSLSAFLT